MDARPSGLRTGSSNGPTSPACMSASTPRVELMTLQAESETRSMSWHNRKNGIEVLIPKLSLAPSRSRNLAKCTGPVKITRSPQTRGPRSLNYTRGFKSLHPYVKSTSAHTHRACHPHCTKPCTRTPAACQGALFGEHRRRRQGARQLSTIGSDCAWGFRPGG